MLGLQRIPHVISADRFPATEGGDDSPSPGLTSKAGWYLSTMGYKGRNSAVSHVENWRQGTMLEDDGGYI